MPTLCNFRHLLEEHGLNKHFFDAINRVMVETGHIMKGGTTVDTTIIRPLAKLNKAVKIADACDHGKAKSKTFSTVTVSLGKDTKSFDKTDSVFDENAVS